ncbi:hypothetical protein BDF14DRAFT_1832045 [Spinellus fusiger]|nr:hypothetical protein BDF14DRAFT_1832045 [Spinellus fusiger]
MDKAPPIARELTVNEISQDPLTETTMSLQHILEDLLRNSEKAGSIRFDEDSTSVHADAVLHTHRIEPALIRDATLNESKLFAASMGVSNTPLRMHAHWGSDPTPLKEPMDDETTTTTLLATAQKLADLCNSPELTDKIEQLRKRHRKSRTSVDQLKKELEKDTQEVEMYSKIPLLPVSQKKEAEEEGGEMGHLRMQAELKHKSEKVAELKKKEKEQRQKQQELKEDIAKEKNTLGLVRRESISLRPGDPANTHIEVHKREIEKLRRDIAKENKLVEEYVLKTEEYTKTKERTEPEPTPPTPGLTSHALYSALCSHMESFVDLLNEKGSSAVEQDGTNELVRITNEIRSTLEKILHHLSQIKAANTYQAYLQHIDQKILSFTVQNPQQVPETTTEEEPPYQPSHMARLIAKILLFLQAPAIRTIGVPLAVLKEEVFSFAESIGVEESVASQAIYRLVGAGLISTDRYSEDLITTLG